MPGEFSLDLKNEKKTKRILVPVEQPDKTPRFVISSAMLHAALLGAVMIFSPLLAQDKKPETISIEIAGGDAPVATTETFKAKAESPIAENKAAEPVIAKAPAPQPEAAPEVVAVKAAPAPKATKVAAVAAARVAKIAAPQIPANLDSEEAPAIDEKQFDQADTDAKMNAEDVDTSLAKAAPKAPAIKADLDQDADEAAKETLASAEAAEKEHEEQNKRISKQQEELKKKNAAALASAQKTQADEENKIAADKAAKEKAAQLAAAKLAADAQAKEAAAAAAAQAQAAQAAQAAKDKAAHDAAVAQAAESQRAAQAAADARVAQQAAAAKSAAGAAPLVRKLEQLKQMPGNAKPAYSESERLNQQQGDAVYLAYINKAGVPENFKQAKSTGFANLDEKTLAALKKWRFVPGQEGWVEIPFRWDLKGDAHETSALGHRSAGLTTDHGALRTTTDTD